MTFSRLSLFQIDADGYSYNGDYRYLVYGNGEGEVVGNVTLNTDADDSYKSGDQPFRQRVEGSAPWFFAYGPNSNADADDADTDIVANEGLIVRSYNAKLGGANVTNPSVSIFSGNRVELAVDGRVGNMLLAGDYIEMALEYIVLPAAPQIATAISNSGTSKTLVEIQGMEPWEQVMLAALRGNFTVTAIDGTAVESNSPVRVRVRAATESFEAPQTAEFSVKANGLPFGLTPIVVAGLQTHQLLSAQYGLWMRSQADDPATPENAWVCVNQSTYTRTDFYQVDYNRELKSYDFVYNVELQVRRSGINRP